MFTLIIIRQACQLEGKPSGQAGWQEDRQTGNNINTYNDNKYSVSHLRKQIIYQYLGCRQYKAKGGFCIQLEAAQCQ